MENIRDELGKKYNALPDEEKRIRMHGKDETMNCVSGRKTLNVQHLANI